MIYEFRIGKMLMDDSSFIHVPNKYIYLRLDGTIHSTCNSFGPKAECEAVRDQYYLSILNGMWNATALR